MKINKAECVVFILTHGRPDNVTTWNTLQKSGYTGPCYLVIDNEDSKASEYRKKWGVEKVVEFDKRKLADSVDEGNNFNERRTITHARNACFQIAEELGYKYFLELDDDYTSFEYRHRTESGKKLLVTKVKDFDGVLAAYLKFLKEVPFVSVAFAQGGGLYWRGRQPLCQIAPIDAKVHEFVFVLHGSPVSIRRCNE